MVNKNTITPPSLSIYILFYYTFYSFFSIRFFPFSSYHLTKTGDKSLCGKDLAVWENCYQVVIFGVFWQVFGCPKE